MNYYNDIDLKVCAWVSELIGNGLLPDGKVDCSSVLEVKPDELEGFNQQHYFCGIGGWARALDLAGFPRGRPVWTASLPCQPFSVAGKKLAHADERHLWPGFFELVRARRPVLLLGEQVANAAWLGWTDGVFADLEAEGYSCGQVVLGAHSVSAPHIRQRIYWVAYLKGDGRLAWVEDHVGRQEEAGGGGVPGLAGPVGGREDGDGVLADSDGGVAGEGRAVQRGGEHLQRAAHGGALRVGDAELAGERRGGQRRPGAEGQEVRQLEDGQGAPDQPRDGRQDARGLGHAEGLGSQDGQRLHGQHDGEEPVDGREPVRGRLADPAGGGLGADRGARREGGHAEQRVEAGGFWSDSVWLPCVDGRSRRIPRQVVEDAPEPVLQRLADGLPEGVDLRGADRAFPLAEAIPCRSSLLRGFGNAIVPQLAAVFVTAVLDKIREG